MGPLRFLICALLLCFAGDADAQSDPFLSLFMPKPSSTPHVVESAKVKDEFLRLEVQHRRVGVLENDIRGTGLVNSDRIVVPRGTPLYYAAFGSSGNLYVRAEHYEGWCGVVPDGGREKGYCMFSNEQGAVLGILPTNGSFYVPRRLADYGLRPITRPEVRESPEAHAKLPIVFLGYSLRAWHKDSIDLSRTAFIDDRAMQLGTLTLPASGAGAEFHLGDTTYTLSRNGDGLAVSAKEQSEHRRDPPVARVEPIKFE